MLVATRSRNLIPFPPTGPYDPPEIGCSSRYWLPFPPTGPCDPPEKSCSSHSQMRSRYWRLRPRTERSCWSLSSHCRRRRRCCRWISSYWTQTQSFDCQQTFWCWWLRSRYPARTTTLLPSPTMPIIEKGFRCMNIYYSISAEGLKTIILVQMKLKTLTLPKDWLRLTVLQAESLIYYRLILQIKHNHQYQRFK